MHVYLQMKDEDLIVTFAGACASLREGFRREIAICRSIERTLAQRGIHAAIIDFRDLVHIDGVCLRAIFAYLGDLASRVRVQIVGPGPALKRLYALLDTLPPIRFERSVALARSAPRSSIEPDLPEWRRIRDELDGSFVDLVRARDAEFRPCPFVVDLQEEAEYLRGEGRELANGPPLRLELRERRAHPSVSRRPRPVVPARGG